MKNIEVGWLMRPDKLWGRRFLEEVAYSENLELFYIDFIKILIDYLHQNVRNNVIIYRGVVYVFNLIILYTIAIIFESQFKKENVRQEYRNQIRLNSRGQELAFQAAGGTIDSKLSALSSLHQTGIFTDFGGNSTLKAEEFSGFEHIAIATYFICPVFYLGLMPSLGFLIFQTRQVGINLWRQIFTWIDFFYLASGILIAI